MATKKSVTKKSPTKAAPAKAKASMAATATKQSAPVKRGTVDPTAKFTWTAKENPFKAGSGAHGRIEILRKLSGQPVAAIRGYKGLRPGTLATALRLGLGRLG